MKYCNSCGKPVVVKVPENDDRERFVCEHCQIVHYRNPHMVVGCLPIHEDKVLLCRRAIEPRHGYWTLPAGFLENGESSVEGALRETWEEARAHVDDETLYTLFDLPQINQVYLFYRGMLRGPDYEPGPESLEVRLFTEPEIPWDELAFPVVTSTLRHYFADRVSGEFPVRTETLRRKRKPGTG